MFRGYDDSHSAADRNVCILVIYDKETGGCTGEFEWRPRSMNTSNAFVAFDFETANSFRSSACAIGVAVFHDGKVVDKIERLIKPIPNYFDPFNIVIHGITPEQVEQESAFDEVWGALEPYFSHSFVVAHNASFDCSVLRAALGGTGCLFPALRYMCSVKLARKTWPDLGSFRLDAVAAHIGFKFKHHNALEDALACGHIVCRAMEVHEATDPADLARRAGIAVGEMWCDGYRTGVRSRRPVKAAS